VLWVGVWAALSQKRTTQMRVLKGGLMTTKKKLRSSLTLVEQLQSM
jgi:hypothetical protein